MTEHEDDGSGSEQYSQIGQGLESKDSKHVGKTAKEGERGSTKITNTTTNQA